jgi:peptidoglycan/xylan/chitin deacetylase (PgdA/CDA1 family)
VRSSQLDSVRNGGGWKSALERSLLPVAFHTRAYRPARFLNRRKVAILTYHGFTDERAPAGIENHERKHVHADDFRAQVTFLKRRYDVRPLREIVQLLATSAPLPKRAVAITMDDGYQSTWRLAFPILRELGAPATIFLATDFVNARKFLWTDRVEYAIGHAAAGAYDVRYPGGSLALTLADTESRSAADRLVRSTFKALSQAMLDQAVSSLERVLRIDLGSAATPPLSSLPLTWANAVEMTGSGVVTMGSHTHSHVILSRCDEATAEAELSQSKRIIERELAAPCDLFCYPNGRRGDFDAGTRRLVQATGYACALTTVHGLNARGADVYELRRFPVTGRLVPGELEVRLSGLVEWPAAALKGGRDRGAASR